MFRSRAVQKASVAASLDAEGSYRSDQGAVWREVSYSLRETQAPSPASDYREGRAKVSHQIDSFVERVQPVDGQVGAIFLCARGILGLELLGEEDLFKGACPRSSGASPSRCSTTRISAACRRRGGLVVGGHAGGPLFGRPSPGAGYDLRIDTGEVIGSGLYWNHSWPTCRAFRGRDPGPLPSGRAPACPAGQRSRNLRR